MEKKTNHLALFAKYWEPGKVKTRLAARIGDTPASQLYFVFLQTLLKRLGDTADQRAIVFSPADRKRDFEEIAQPNWTIAPQSDGSLGQRLTEYTQSILAAPEPSGATSNPNSQRLLVIGSDCVELEPSHLEFAFAKLDEVDVVLGPSFDGGYYLIGMSKPTPFAFERIQWSTDSVFQQTVERLDEHNLTYHVLDSFHDIDELDDLKNLLDRLESLNAGQDLTQEELMNAIQSALVTS